MPRWPAADRSGRRPSRRPHDPPPARVPPRWPAASARQHLRVLAGALALALAGCAPRLQRSPLPYDPAREAARVRAVVDAFVAAESRGDGTADTLLAADADFVASGIAVTRAPRLAAVLGRGDGAVEDVRIQLAGDFAWVVLVYRWSGAGDDDVERGRATAVLERREGGWRIRHLHSSTVAPWR